MPQIEKKDFNALVQLIAKQSLTEQDRTSLVRMIFPNYQEIYLNINYNGTPNQFASNLLTFILEKNHFNQLILDLFIFFEDNYGLDTQEAVHSIKNRIFNRNKSEVPEVLYSGKSPYPGLRPFHEGEADYFFGRKKESKEILSRLIKNKLIAVIGASGVGKSSLVMAGVIPQLPSNTKYIRFTPSEVGDNPFMSLSVQINNILPKDSNLNIKEIEEYLRRNPTHIFDIIFSNEANEGERLLFFIDQFEEVFTSANVKYRESFIGLLSLINELQVDLILTIRADFFQECLKYQFLGQVLNTSQYVVGPPTIENLFDIISNPAEKCNLTFESNLKWKILNDVNLDRSSLPLLSSLLRELFEKREGNTLTIDTYNELRGVKGVISRKAETAFISLKGLSVNEKDKIFNTVFSSLISISRDSQIYKQKIILSQFEMDSKIELFIDNFVNARLLIKDKDKDNRPTLELSHEALFKYWPRLKKWISRHKDDISLLIKLREDAKEWIEKSKKSAYLWNDEKLALVYKMLENLNPKLKSYEKEFIEPEKKKILEELYKSSLPGIDRSALGDRLNFLKDSRKGISIAANSPNLPEFNWCPVRMGRIELDKFGAFNIDNFLISKYLVTFKQFHAFISSENGYKKTEWWVGLSEKNNNYQAMAYKYDNYPIVDVNWYESIAFCRWLTHEYKKQNIIFDGFENDYLIRLPTEWEWVYASIGDNVEFNYTWGKDWKQDCSNTHESGIGKPTAVGLFPCSSSPFGVLDMCGNVQEWCLNKYEDVRKIDERGTQRRTLKGGSWKQTQQFACVKNRFFGFPKDRSNYIGFRIIVSSK